MIAGGGPAGATLALLLGRAGLTVELYEAKTFPREKPCGEGIMPAGVAVLERLGPARAPSAAGRSRPSATTASGMTAESRLPAARGRDRRPSRSASGGWLLDRDVAGRGARDAGRARVRGGAGRGRRDRAAAARSACASAASCGAAAWSSGADGLDSPVRRSLGLDRRGRGDRRVGVRMHYRLAAGRGEPSRLEIFVGRGYELYAAPLPDGELLLAALADRARLRSAARATSMERWIGEQPLLRDWLDGATPLTKPAGRAPVTRRARAGYAPGAVLLGDAARATDPLTAGGIAHALVTAERLAAIVPRVLAEGDAPLARFDRERRRLLRAHDWLTRALVFLVDRPRWPARRCAAMRAAPRLMRALLGIGGGVGIRPPVSRGRASRPRPAPRRAAGEQRDRPERDAVPARRIGVAAANHARRLPDRDRRKHERRDRRRAPAARPAASSGSAPNPAIVSAAYSRAPAAAPSRTTSVRLPATASPAASGSSIASSIANCSTHGSRQAAKMRGASSPACSVVAEQRNAQRDHERRGELAQPARGEAQRRRAVTPGQRRS